MANDRNAGRPTKFPKNIESKVLRVLVPTLKYAEFKESINNHVKEQFDKYDWT